MDFGDLLYKAKRFDPKIAARSQSWPTRPDLRRKRKSKSKGVSHHIHLGVSAASGPSSILRSGTRMISKVEAAADDGEVRGARLETKYHPGERLRHACPAPMFHRPPHHMLRFAHPLSPPNPASIIRASEVESYVSNQPIAFKSSCLSMSQSLTFKARFTLPQLISSPLTMTRSHNPTSMKSSPKTKNYWDRGCKTI